MAKKVIDTDAMLQKLAEVSEDAAMFFRRALEIRSLQQQLEKDDFWTGDARAAPKKLEAGAEIMVANGAQALWGALIGDADESFYR